MKKFVPALAGVLALIATVAAYGAAPAPVITVTSVTSDSVTIKVPKCGTYRFRVAQKQTNGTYSANAEKVVAVACAPPPPPPPAACADGIDNDGDGLIDYPADPGCTSTSDTDETNAVTGSEPAAIAGQGYHVTFADEFNSLGSTTWSDGIWYDPGSAANSVYVSNGVLNLVSRRSQGYPDVTVTTEAGSSPHVFKYGYFEASMRWTKGAGAWPAFWLYSYQHAIDSNQCTTLGGEIDAFEGQGTEPSVYYGTVHSNTNGCSPSDVQNGNNYHPVGVDLTAAFHTYGVLWTATTVSWFLDNGLLMSAPTYASDNQTMFLLFQMWIGGWTSGTNSTTPDELKTEVDYVHVWQK